MPNIISVWNGIFIRDSIHSVEYFFDVDNYSLEKTLQSGQAFRWSPWLGGYQGIIGKNVVQLTQLDNGIKAVVKEGKLSEDKLRDYLRVDENYSEIISAISFDPYVKKSVDNQNGYRILNQDPFEMLISFIDSANNSIHNIKMQIGKLSQMFGSEIASDFYSFPEPERIAGLSEKEIKKAGVGFRGKYMIEASKRVLENPDLLNDIGVVDSSDARERLTGIPGVGDKISDCILLFGYNRIDRVPIDVWTRRIFTNLYGKDEKAKYEDLQNFAYEKFGQYAGYAFSFLFEEARAGRLF